MTSGHCPSISIGDDERMKEYQKALDDLHARALPADTEMTAKMAQSGPIARAGAIVDVSDVIIAATIAIRDAMTEGARAGYVNEWQEQDENEHLGHAWQHVIEASKNRRNCEYKTEREMADFDSEFEMHISHAICRLAMCSLRHEEDK